MPIDKKTVKLADGTNIEHDDDAEATHEDFTIGSGGGGLMPNRLTYGQERGQYWKDVQEDLKAQAAAIKKGQIPTPSKPGRMRMADIPFTKGSRQARAKAKK